MPILSIIVAALLSASSVPPGEAGEAFDCTGQVAVVCGDSPQRFMLLQDEGVRFSLNRSFWLEHPESYTLKSGDIVHITGERRKPTGIIKDEQPLQSAFVVTNLVTVRHGRLPEPAKVEANEINGGRLTGKFVNKELADDAKIRSLLGKDEYFNAAKTFINDVEGELNPNIFKALWWRILAALGIGGGVTGIAAGSHKALKKTKKRHYLKDNRINVLEKNERLIGTDVSRNVTKQPKTSGTDHEIGSGHGGSNTF